MSRLPEQVVGHAAEHFVCFDLAKRGFRVVSNMFEGSQYDVVAEHEGKFIKIQVKGTACPKNKIGGAGYVTPTYKFTIRDVSILNVDIIAFVAMDIEKILYVDVAQAKGISRSKWVSIGRMMTPDDSAIIKYFGTNKLVEATKKSGKPLEATTGLE